MKRALALVLVCCLLLALMPFAIIKLTGEGLIWFADWCVVRRRWSRALVALINRVGEMGEKR